MLLVRLRNANVCCSFAGEMFLIVSGIDTDSISRSWFCEFLSMHVHPSLLSQPSKPATARSFKLPTTLGEQQPSNTAEPWAWPVRASWFQTKAFTTWSDPRLRFYFQIRWLLRLVKFPRAWQNEWDSSTDICYSYPWQSALARHSFIVISLFSSLERK